MKKKFEKLDKLEFVIEHIIVITIIILAFSFNIMNYNRIEGLAQVKNSILNQENQDSKATYHGAWHETLDIKKGDETIEGVFYTAEGQGPMPTVILCHGFGVSSDFYDQYVEKYQKAGFNTYAFNFVNGGYKDSVEDMSILTEADDLELVYERLCEFEKVDSEKIFIVGESQGGLVATYVGSQLKDKIRGLILLYPAYEIQDDIKTRTNPDNDMDPLNFLGWKISPIYNSDGLSFDVYDIMSDYQGQTLILQGDDDEIVPMEYAKRAADEFENAKLVIYEGAGHGWADGEFKDQAIKDSIEFIGNNI